jgi:NADPH-dependent 2,4-dienoyl-CoA reductase/sulfur reductase-like enzyme
VTRPIVLAGGGLAAQRCAETLRRCGHDGPIAIVCAEPTPPYDRPPLSKELLAGSVDAGAIRLRADAWYADHDVELLLQTPATGLDVRARELLLGDGRRLAYDRLVIATGARARPIGGGLTLRDAADAERLRATLAPGARLVVVGGGLIGQEVAATAVALGVQVTILERDPAPMAAVLGPQVAHLLAALHRSAGIALECGVEVHAVHPDRVVLADGRRLDADAVLVAVGAVPAVDWLAGTPLHGARGVPVDACARTRVPAIHAVGDCADRGEPGHDHWEAAAHQGATAARAILGLPIGAAPAPSFWSDQHGTRLHVVGRPWCADRVAIEGDVDARDCAVSYFTADGRLVGALLVGRGRDLPAVRRRLTAETSERKAA